ncbi:MAG: hypothetical protein AB1813_04900 [Verrucomicrobiota bacterium]
MIKPNSFTVTWQIPPDAAETSTPKLVLVLRPHEMPSWRPVDGTDYELTPSGLLGPAFRSVAGNTVSVSVSNAREESLHRVVVVDAAIDFGVPSLASRTVALEFRNVAMGTGHRVAAWLQRFHTSSQQVSYHDLSTTRVVTHLGGTLDQELALRTADSPFRIVEDLLIRFPGALAAVDVEISADKGVNIHVDADALLLMNRSQMSSTVFEENWGSIIIEEGGDLLIENSEISEGGRDRTSPLPGAQIVIRSLGSQAGLPALLGSAIGFGAGAGVELNGGAVEIGESEAGIMSDISHNQGAGLLVSQLNGESLVDGLMLQNNGGAGLEIHRLEPGSRFRFDQMTLRNNREGVVVTGELEPEQLAGGSSVIIEDNQWSGTPGGSANLVIRKFQIELDDLKHLVDTFHPLGLFLDAPTLLRNENEEDESGGFLILEDETWLIGEAAFPDDPLERIKSIRIGSEGLSIFGDLLLAGDITVLLDDRKVPTGAFWPAGIRVWPGGGLAADEGDGGGVLFTATSKGEWGGIRFMSGSEGVLQQATIERGNSLADDAMLIIESSDVQVLKSKIGPTRGHGVLIRHALPMLQENFIYGCRKHGVLYEGFRGLQLLGNSFSLTNGWGSSRKFEALAVDGRVLYQGDYLIDARSNYWGHASGPTHPLNLDGTGAWLGLNIRFDPWIGKNQETPPDLSKIGAPSKAVAAPARPWHSKTLRFGSGDFNARDPGIEFVTPLPGGDPFTDRFLVAVSPDRPPRFTPKRHDTRVPIYAGDFRQGRELVLSHHERNSVRLNASIDYYEPGRRYYFQSWKARQVQAAQDRIDWVFDPVPEGAGFFTAPLPNLISSRVSVIPRSNPVPVPARVVIQTGGELRISPQTILKLTGNHCSFLVQSGGILSADDAIFTVAADDSLGDDNDDNGAVLPAEMRFRSWGGITVSQGGSAAVTRSHFLNLSGLLLVQAAEVSFLENTVERVELGGNPVSGQALTLSGEGLGARINRNAFFSGSIIADKPDWENENEETFTFTGPFGTINENECILVHRDDLIALRSHSAGMTIVSNRLSHLSGLPVSIAVRDRGFTPTLLSNDVRYFFAASPVVLTNRLSITNHPQDVTLIGSFRVVGGAHLELGAGVKVLPLFGSIEVETGGTFEAKNVIFTSAGDTQVAPAILPDAGASLSASLDQLHGGITFGPGSSGFLENCLIRHGAVGTVPEINFPTATIFGLQPQIFIQSSSVRIQGCAIEQNPPGPASVPGFGVQGIMIMDASPLILGNRINVNSANIGQRTACVMTYRSTPILKENLFSACATFCSGVLVLETRAGLPADTIDARENSWASVQGPFHSVNNPGGDGVRVSDAVRFDPWLEKLALPPIITPPPDVRVEAAGPLTIVNLGVANAIDLIDGVVSVRANQSGPFPVGRHEIIWTAQDKEGNTGAATQIVLVQDSLPPVVTAPPPLRIETPRVPIAVELGLSTALDRVDGPLMPIPDRSGPFGEGYHEIRWTARDAAGNVGTAWQSLIVRLKVRETNDVIIPKLLSIMRLSAGQAMELTWQGQPGFLDQIEASTDLRQWSSASDLQLEGSAANPLLKQQFDLLSDPTRSQMFYRIKRVQKP